MPAASPDDHRSLETPDLLALWCDCDERAYAELRRRVLPFLAPLARAECNGICHQGVGDVCPGATCDQAYPWLIEDLLDRALGHAQGWCGHKRARRGMAYGWLGSGAAAKGIPLSGYLRWGIRARGGRAEAKRVWRAHLGAAARFRYSLEVTPAALWQAWYEVIGRADLPPAIGEAIAALGLDRWEGLERMVKALFEDSADVGWEERFSPTRIARYLRRGGQVDPGFVRLVAVGAELVDATLALHAPRWTERYLEVARRATWRPSRPYPAIGTPRQPTQTGYAEAG